MTYTNITYANHVNVPHSTADRIMSTNHKIKHALNMLEKKDNGSVSLTYYRQGQILSFYINDYDAKSQFEKKSLAKQVHYFERMSGVFSVSPQVQMTKRAEHNHSIQVSEQHKQQIENHIEAQQAIAKAKARAKAQAAAKKKAAQAKAKKAAQAKQKKQKAQQAKQQAQKKQNNNKKMKQKGNQNAKAKH